MEISLLSMFYIHAFIVSSHEICNYIRLKTWIFMLVFGSSEQLQYSNLVISSALEGWSILWMVLPVLYKSDTCVDHIIRWYNSLTDIFAHKLILKHLQSSLNQGSWKASECGDVSGIAGLTNPLFQLVKKNQLLPVYSSL